jgi:ATP-binding cassette subfamily F protein 3
MNKAERQARIAERRPLVKELEQVELNIAKWQADKKVCDDRLNESELYTASDKSELQQHLKKQAELANQIELAEERWLELHELLEAMPALD